MFYTSSVLAFELSSNHYGAFGRLLKGKQTYTPSLVFPFSESIQIDSNFEAHFYSEKLPAILTEDYSKFYLYTKGYHSDYTTILVNDTEIDKSNISVTSFYESGDTIQLVEIEISNVHITADEVALIKVNSNTNTPFWIFQERISNHFNIYPTQIVTRKDNGDFYRRYTVESHCLEPVNHVSVELRTHTIDLTFKEGFQIQVFDLPLIDKTATYSAKVFVNGLLYGTEDIYESKWEENSVHLIPVISSAQVNDFTSEYPFEMDNKNNEWTPLLTDHETFSRQINYSIDIENSRYQENIGFLQEEDIRSFSSIWFDKPYPSRDVLGRMMDVNIKTLGYFQKETFGYPETYFKADNMAYVYEDAASRELLIYKQFNSVKYTSLTNLDEHILRHEYKLRTKKHPFKQSLIFIHLNTQDDLKFLNVYINQWNENYQSPTLSIDNFNQFGRLFLNRNRTRLSHKVQVESPFRLNYNTLEAFEVNTNWISTLSQSSHPTLKSNEISVFNPNSTSFEGIIQFNHDSDFKSAQLSDGTPLKLQKHSTNTYFAFLPKMEPYEIKTLSLKTSGSSQKGKSYFLGLNKRSGVVNWQYKGHKLAKKRQDLFVPLFRNKMDEASLRIDDGYLKKKGPLFTEYERRIVTDQGTQMTLNTLVFNDLPMVKYLYNASIAERDHISTHIQFNYPSIPSQYSIDRVYKEEYGYSKFGNHNVLESKHSIFLLNKTKILLSSPQRLRWQYNGITFNTNGVGFIESSTFPNQLNLLISGQITSDGNLQLTESHYELNVLLGDENSEMEMPQVQPLCMEELSIKQKELTLFKIDNQQIHIVNIHATEKNNQFILELKNTSDIAENATFTPRRNKSTVYECLFSGKKTGIIKGKMRFEPQELKTIRISL